MNRLVSLLAGTLLFTLGSTLSAPRVLAQAETNPTSSLDSLYEGLKFRNIGPFRGGRVNAVTGVPGHPRRYYMGSTGGGVWRSDNAGMNWHNVSDGYFNVGSVGAIAVAPSDPNVLYVGTGEHAVRGVMTSAGDGMYKSTDAGDTWTHIGLPDSRQIAEIEVHPSNPEYVWVAVQGSAYADSEHRGVYRSTNGGATWTKTLYVDATSGAADLSLDPTNPRILYVGMWDHRRTPWAVRSGGPGSGIYKSVDAGLTWKRLDKGLPDTLGKVAVDVSAANPKRVYANIEAEGEKGGVYRSDDGGASWSQVNKDRVNVARAWYYIEVFADPVDANRVYVLNAPMMRSIDGGKTFQGVSNPHSDQHDLWTNPNDPSNMILGNDGGGTITFDGGESWSTQANQPTAQFYRVITDAQMPYRIYGGQQDNSSVDIMSRTRGGSIGTSDWRPSAGGESAFIALDPDNPRYVFGGSYQGNLSVYDTETDTERDIMAYPVTGLATTASDMRYRFNWNAPLVAQPQDPSILYHGANVVLRSDDMGQSWTEISPDLTRDDLTRQGVAGFPFTNEGAGGENYNTISYMAASTHRVGELWVGTDDGLVWCRPEPGTDWQRVTPPGLGERLVNAIEISPHNPDRVYLAVTGYKADDNRPYIYRTEDAGRTWQTRVVGLPDSIYVHVVREDAQRPGLLYAGTSRGLYVSFDDGTEWTRFQRNLPVAPILDLTTRDNDLVVATSGRAFWILDDLSALQQVAEVTGAQLVAPKSTVRYSLSGGDGKAPKRPTAGQNPAAGMIIDYFLPEKLADSTVLTLDILDESESVIRSYTSAAQKDFKPWTGGPSKPQRLSAKRGLNRFNWDLRRDQLPAVEGVFVLGDYRGGVVGPGTYTLRLNTPSDTLTAEAKVLADPNLSSEAADYDAQQQITQGVETTVRDIHESVNRMRKVRDQLRALNKTLATHDEHTALVDRGQTILDSLTAWEEQLIQPKQKTFQDVINFPNQLNAELMNLKSRVDGIVPGATAGSRERLRDLQGEWAAHRAKMTRLIEDDVAGYNAAYAEAGLPAVVVPEVGE